MDPQYILGLDIGTSSVRAALCNDKGEMLPESLVKHKRRLESKLAGGAEIDADEALEQVVDVIDRVLGKSEGEIAFVGVSSFWHSLVGIDADGKATTKLFGWADNQSRDYVRILRARFNEEEIHRRTGARFHTSYWPAKLLWLREEFPDVWKNTARWLSFSEYLALEFFGSPATSISMASGTGIFDIRKCDWDPELLRFLKLDAAMLPEIAVTHPPLTPKFAKRWPRLRRARWFTAIGDGAANNIGSGCMDKSKAALMLGTSGAIRIAYEGLPPDEIPPGLWCYRIDRKRVVIGGALSDGGGLYQWLRENFRIDERTEAEIENRMPDCGGLAFMPFVAGERGTGYNEFAAGAIVGITTATTPIDILHAAMESVAYRFAEIYEQLAGISNIREIAASGGALRESRVWRQIIADVLGRDLRLSDAREASLLGAVHFVLETAGKIEKIRTLPKTSGAAVKCRKKHQIIYRKARKKHNEIYARLFGKPF